MPHKVQVRANTRLEDWQLKLARTEIFPDGPAMVLWLWQVELWQDRQR